MGSGCEEGARVEVPIGLRDGDGVGGVGSLGSGLVEGEGEGVPKRVASDIDLGEGLSTQ